MDSTKNRMYYKLTYIIQGKTRRIQEISTRISLEVPLHMLEGVKNIYEISTIYFWASVGVRWGGGVRWSPLCCQGALAGCGSRLPQQVDQLTEL